MEENWLQRINRELGWVMFLLLAIFIGQCSMSSKLPLPSKKHSPWVKIDHRPAYLQQYADYTKKFIIFTATDSTVFRGSVDEVKRSYRKKNLKEIKVVNGPEGKLWAKRLEQRMFETGRY